MQKTYWLALAFVASGCKGPGAVPEDSDDAALEAPVTTLCSVYDDLDDELPFAPAAGEEGSLAVPLGDRKILGWATAQTAYVVGDGVDEEWTDAELSLGPAEGNAFDVVALGEGGRITLQFEPPIADGKGFDFAVFENSFSDDFLELAWVEVSSDGRHFVRFPSLSRVADPIGPYGTLAPTLIDGFAGKYRQGFGTPFDLGVLREAPEVLSKTVDLAAIRAVRLLDVVGDGTHPDCQDHPIYDPYPTTGSAGFDLDAIAVLHQP